MSSSRRSLSSALWRSTTLILALTLAIADATQGQPPPANKEAAVADPESAFLIEVLHTRVRFEADGTGSREVRALIRLHSETGIRQFSRLVFGYNRASEELEIPTVRVAHASGGSMEILPSAIGDRPVAAVAEAPAYQDVREKFVRVAGLSPGDQLEYRVLMKSVHPPFAPDFFFSYSFAHETPIEQEILEIDLPAVRSVRMRVSPAIPATSVERFGEGPGARTVYRWQLNSLRHISSERDPDETKPIPADVALSTFSSWQEFSQRLAQCLARPSPVSAEIAARAEALTSSAGQLEDKLEALYDFVAQKIRTIDLPLGATGFRTRSAPEILASGYATPEDKYVLCSALASTLSIVTYPALVPRDKAAVERLPDPSLFGHLLAAASTARHKYWLEPNLEVAPFGMVSSVLRGAPALPVIALRDPAVDRLEWETVPIEPPFSPTQEVEVNAKLTLRDGFAARVRYRMRGDNELLLRLAYHHAPREQWKGLTQVMALSDGFHGQVSDVVVSDPLATRGPLTIEYAIVQPGVLRGSKLPMKLPVPLPVLGLPEAPAKALAGPIDLGTPLDIDMHVRLRLPPGMAVRVPVPVSVRREYAEFASSYAHHGTLVTASRHLRFLRREVASGDATDYAAFVRAIRGDEAQELTLDRAPAAHSSASSAGRPR